MLAFATAFAGSGLTVYGAAHFVGHWPSHQQLEDAENGHFDVWVLGYLTAVVILGALGVLVQFWLLRRKEQRGGGGGRTRRRDNDWEEEQSFLRRTSSRRDTSSPEPTKLEIVVTSANDNTPEKQNVNTTFKSTAVERHAGEWSMNSNNASRNHHFNKTEKSEQTPHAPVLKTGNFIDGERGQNQGDFVVDDFDQNLQAFNDHKTDHQIQSNKELQESITFLQKFSAISQGKAVILGTNETFFTDQAPATEIILPEDFQDQKSLVDDSSDLAMDLYVDVEASPRLFHVPLNSPNIHDVGRTAIKI